MSPINVYKSESINLVDTISIHGNINSFILDDKNETGDELILIYMYILPKFQTHGVKVGMTKCRRDETFWHAIKTRISNQVHELALNQDQFNKYGQNKEVIYWGICIDAKNESFKDYHVHNEIKTKCSGLVEKEQEWFTNVPTEELVSVFENCRKDRLEKEIFTPRKEQRECIDALSTYFKKHQYGGRFLLNCKMRFGKSYTTYKYCEEAGIDKILILTFVPAVESSWKDDLLHIKKDYKYFTDADLKKKSFWPEDVYDPFVIFLSLQNYLGKDRNSFEAKEKIKKLQRVDYDLVIFDEYHFGAWNSRTQETLEDFDPEYQNAISKKKDILNDFSIKTAKTICLSGTPFKALAKGEFGDEDSFTYSYFDEQKNKYPDENNMSIVNPDYAYFPDMKIFGYNMSTLFGDLSDQLLSDDKLLGKKYFSLNRFFETKNDSDARQPHEFVYEDCIKYWLKIIKGLSPNGNNYPYSNKRMLENNKHTLWLMPTVSSCKAMYKTLMNDDYFSRYEIVNLSDDSVGSGVKAYETLMDTITASSNLGKLGSIAITVNKLTIGVTVKDWFSVFVLKDLSSPEQYFQSIFRIQTPYKEAHKTDGFVYDFNIDRAAALLLKYAEQAETGQNSTKLDIAKLIVKYLPIYTNGNMNEPISYEIFYQLANFGDLSGIPLSKKIRNTAVTTRMGDDETIAAMLNDPEVSDIIKRVFAHARFKTPKTKTHASAPEDGFDSKIASKGREIGHKLGMKDSKYYLDLDDNSVQIEYTRKEEEHIKKYTPVNLSDNEKIYFSNGFKKGYESGVNAPIRKLQCGKDDGLKFVDEVKKKFGKKIQYTKKTRTQINNFVKGHLNVISNIPIEYRGMLYKRWYAESFLWAVKQALTPKIEKSEGTVEDADNVIKHILSRLFEFLYISVYRETTFDEIFKNADPNTFLEAVGITKEDFETLNKYKVFQEDVLNNYIHEFFVNESIGENLDLSNEIVKQSYRNSFDWFGYGIKHDD